MVLLLIPAILSLPFAHAFSNGQSATTVIGQPNLTSNGRGSNQTSLNTPMAIAFDQSGNLWVADSANGRVLEYKAPLATGEAASIALGQSNTSAISFGFNCNGSSVITASCLATPTGLAFDPSGNLWVSDSTNNRVVEFKPPFVNNENASVAIGQPDLTTGANPDATPTASDLSQPAGIGFDTSGNLWVADTLYNRVLEFKAPLTTGEAASVVLGQDNFTSGISANYPSTCPYHTECPSAASLTAPDGVTVDSSGNVWTSERNTGRILEFVGPFTNGESASLVLGQPGFNTFQSGGGFYCSIVTPAQFCASPDSVTFDKSGTMWVADTGYSRVVSFTPPFTTHENETNVIGFANFTALLHSGILNATAYNFSTPESIAFDSSGNMWVSDSGQNRVLEFPASSIGTSTTQSVAMTSSQSSTTSSSQATSSVLLQSSSTTTTSSLVTASTAASTSSTSSTSSKSGGGVPVFPYQFSIAAIFTILLAASYLLIRRRTLSRA